MVCASAERTGSEVDGMAANCSPGFGSRTGGCFFGAGDGERRGAISSLPLFGEGDGSGCCTEADGTGAGVCWTAKCLSFVPVLELLYINKPMIAATTRSVAKATAEVPKPHANPRAGARRGVARIFLSARF